MEALESDQGKREQFVDSGYAYWKGLADAASLRSVQRAITRLVEERSGQPIEGEGAALRKRIDATLLRLHKSGPAHKSFIYDTLPHLPEVVSLACSPSVLSAVKHCLGVDQDSLVTFINVNLRIDLPGADWEHNLPWHQDYPYRNKLYARGASVVLWMPIFDCPRSVGPVEVQPGSHRLGEVSTVEIPRSIGAPHWTIPENVLQKNPIDGIQYEMSAGDALLFDILLVHRSGRNNDDERVRWSLQARYSNPHASTYLPQYR